MHGMSHQEARLGRAQSEESVWGVMPGEWLVAALGTGFLPCSWAFSLLLILSLMGNPNQQSGYRTVIISLNASTQGCNPSEVLRLRGLT